MNDFSIRTKSSFDILKKEINETSTKIEDQFRIV
jgi:hypothetical protein